MNAIFAFKNALQIVQAENWVLYGEKVINSHEKKDYLRTNHVSRFVSFGI